MTFNNKVLTGLLINICFWSFVGCSGEKEDVLAKAKRYYQKKNFQKAAKYFTEVRDGSAQASKSRADALYHLAIMHQSAHGFEQNSYQSKNLAQKSAELGHNPARLMLSKYYLTGVGTDQDHDSAFEWMQKAAHESYPDALEGLGDYFSKGIGIFRDAYLTFEF